MTYIPCSSAHFDLLVLTSIFDSCLNQLLLRQLQNGDFFPTFIIPSTFIIWHSAIRNPSPSSVIINIYFVLKCVPNLVGSHLSTFAVPFRQVLWFLFLFVFFNSIFLLYTRLFEVHLKLILQRVLNLFWVDGVKKPQSQHCVSIQERILTCSHKEGRTAGTVHSC